MFMFDDVPEPVWNTSTGNWSSQRPAATSAAAAAIASADAPVDGTSRARRSPGRRCRLDQGERADERAVDGQAGDREVLDGPLRLRCPRAPAGTRTSPIVSCSMRYSMSLLSPSCRHRAADPSCSSPCR